MPHHRAIIPTTLLALTLALTGTSASAQAPLLAGERDAQVTAIPGVVATGAQWQLVWADFETADGIVGSPGGGVLFAQEQSDSVRHLDTNHTETIVVPNARGPGAVSLDAEGRLFAVQRTCTDPGRAFSQSCAELTQVVQLLPDFRVLANRFPDGSSLGRLNDLIADGKGGAYFTVGGAWHVSADGAIDTVADQNIRSNGIMLNQDGTVLYVTNNTEVLAFDVQPDGSTSNRRVFGTLDGDEGGDGMAIDNANRLYVTGTLGVHVLDADGAYLGLIPTPRRPITLAFSGLNRKTLYVPSMGAVGPDGKAWTTPTGVRNTAMTIYTLPMESQGFAGRPK